MFSDVIITLSCVIVKDGPTDKGQIIIINSSPKIFANLGYHIIAG